MDLNRIEVRMKMIDHKVLKEEILSDPNKLGYEGKSPIDIARLLNKPVKSATIPVDAEVPTWRLLDAIDLAEYKNLASDEKEMVRTILSMGSVNLASANIRKILTGVFPSGTKTYANITKLAFKVPTRAEQLFGYGAVVSHLDVARALKEEG